MARPEFLPVPLKGNSASAEGGTAVTGASRAVVVDRFRDKAVAFDFATNTFVGTIQLEGTMDGSTWFPIGSVVNANGAVVTWAYTVRKIRTNTTLATSGGVAVATFGGLDFRAQ